MSISVIVPSHNNKQEIIKNLSPILTNDYCELIVVESGQDKAQLPRTQWLYSSIHNRAHQMNQGAKVAQGSLLVFLYPETKVHPTQLTELLHTMTKRPKYMGGALRLKIRHPSFLARVIEWGAYLRQILFKIVYGDQGIFVWRDVFRLLGGYPEVPIFEDVLFMQKLIKKGEVYWAPNKAYVDAKKGMSISFLKQAWIRWRTFLKWKCGVSLEDLAKYQRQALGFAQKAEGDSKAQSKEEM